MYLLLFLAVALAGVTAMLAVGRSGSGGEPGQQEPARLDGLDGIVEADPTLPPVLLPDRPSASDVRNLRFGVGLRGYRMDQVDEVLEVLGRELERRDRAIADLARQVSGAGGGAGEPRAGQDTV
jgi:DivIVA domain-containing protein